MMWAVDSGESASITVHVGYFGGYWTCHW
jgi:hypothetical protein